MLTSTAHFLRNTTTKLFKAAYAISAERVWCLTGTPIQNSIMDLEALVQILRAKPFDNPGTYAYEIVQPIKANEKSAFLKLRRLIACLSLRRTKEILDLPSRTDRYDQISLSREENDLYTFVSARLLEQIDKDLANRVDRCSLAHVMELILRLRQICNHGRDLLPPELLSSIDNDTGELVFSQASQVRLVRCEICDKEAEELLSELECMHLVCSKCSQRLQQEQPEAEESCPICCNIVPEASSRMVQTSKISGTRIRHIRPSSKVSRLIENLQSLQTAASSECPNKR